MDNTWGIWFIVCGGGIGAVVFVMLIALLIFYRAQGAQDRVIKWWIESEEKEKENEKTV